MPIIITIPDNTTPLKRDIVQLAFEEIGIAGYEFNADPEEYTLALRRLNALMRDDPWNRAPYQQPTYGQGSLDDFSGIDPKDLNVVATYLGMRISPPFGATMGKEAITNLNRAFNAFQARYAFRPRRVLKNTTPLGAGARPLGWFLGRNYATGTDATVAEDDA